MSREIFIVAGEASGDLHAAQLVREIQKREKDLSFFGLGGNRLREASVELLFNIEELAVTGITETLVKVVHYFRVFREVVRVARERRPSLAILVDYPDFNLRLAKRLRLAKIPIVYYISPQVWAWRRRRIPRIANLVDKMLVVFPFEEELYQQYDVDVEFVGHPLLDCPQLPGSRERFLERHDLDENQAIVGLLPGSRENEIVRLLPIMLEATRHLGNELNYVLLGAETVSANCYRSFLEKAPHPVRLILDDPRATMHFLDVAAVASGTATLELALHCVPMVVVYRVALLTYLLGQLLIDVDRIAMVNILAGEEVVPELLQYQCTPSSIADQIKDLLDEGRQGALRNRLQQVRTLLGEEGASRRAATAITEFLNATQETDARETAIIEKTV